jgi:hypothetical protein
VAVGAALRASLRRLGLDGRLEQARAVVIWPEVVGPELARHARAVEVSGGVLRVAVRSSAWAAQLSFFRSDLVRRLNERLGPPGVLGLRFSVGFAQAGIGGEGGSGPGRRQAAEPTAADRVRVEEAAAAVADPDVRRALRRALLAAVARRRRLEE